MPVVETINVSGSLNPQSNVSGSFEPANQVSGDTSKKIDIDGNLSNKKSISGNLSKLSTSVSGNLSNQNNSLSGDVKSTKSIDGNLHIGAGVPVEDLGELAFKDEASGSCTPKGTVSAPVITIAREGTITTIKNPTARTVATSVIASAPEGSVPDNSITYYRMNGENLALYQLGYTTGESINTSDVVVKTGDSVYQASEPIFTGTEETITVS